MKKHILIFLNIIIQVTILYYGIHYFHNIYCGLWEHRLMYTNPFIGIPILIFIFLNYIIYKKFYTKEYYLYIIFSIVFYILLNQQYDLFDSCILPIN